LPNALGLSLQSQYLCPGGRFQADQGRAAHLRQDDCQRQRNLAFCETCGSPLYACAVENPQAYSLRTGVLQQRDALGTPQREIWTKRRRPWVALAGVSETHDGQP